MMTNWAATCAAGLSMVLVIFNAVLVSNNQTSQLAVRQRQQLINQSADLVRIEQAMMRSAIAAANPNDEAYKKLLARYNLRQPQTAPSAPASARRGK